MKFKILKGTDLYAKLKQLQEKATVCSQAAQNLAKEIGATHAYTNNRNRAGGVQAFRFEYGKEPEKTLWLQPDRHNNKQLFYPRTGKAKLLRANDELHQRIENLPLLTHDEYNNTIGFKVQCTSKLEWVSSYGLQINDDYALIEIHEGCKFEPLPDMIEITVSEYNKLKQKED